MKKLGLLFLILSSLLYAEATIYFGAGYEYNNEIVSYDSMEETVNNNALKIKAGYGDRDAYAIEFAVNYVDNRSSIFDTNDGKKYGFDITLLKAWNLGFVFNPYLKAGFGAGYLETPADLHNGSLTYGSFNLGAGCFIPVDKHTDIELAYEYKNVSYQKLDLNSTLTPSSHLNTLYIGVNFRF